MDIFHFSLLNISVLATLLFWGAWGIFDKISLRYASPLLVMIALNSFAPVAIVIMCFVLDYFKLWSNLTTEVFFWTFWGGLTYYLAMLMYLFALSKTEASFILGLTSSYPVIVQFFSTMILGEALVLTRILASVVIAFGVISIGFSQKDKTQFDNLSSNLSLWIAIAGATILWGIWGVFDKKAIILSGACEVFFCKSLWDLFFTSLFLLLIFYCIKTEIGWIKNKVDGELSSLFYLETLHSEGSRAPFFLPFKSKKLWAPVLVSAFCLYAGGLTYLFALSKATASYVIVITGCYPLIMYLLAVILLKEKFNKIRLIGIVLITFGGVLTQLTEAQ